jgi:hypothetical protein
VRSVCLVLSVCVVVYVGVHQCAALSHVALVFCCL